MIHVCERHRSIGCVPLDLQYKKVEFTLKKAAEKYIGVFFRLPLFLFFSEMIQKFDISPRQARVAIVEYSDSASLSVAFDNYGSKTRLMCAVKDLDYLGNKRSYKFLMTNTRFCLWLVLRRLYYHFFFVSNGSPK